MQIYYINLARRADRRSFMESQFEKLRLEATRIEAVTPERLTDADRRRAPNYITGRQFPEPALCCVLSHLSAMRAFLSTSAPRALILEDDALISESLPGFLSAFESNPPPGLVIRLEAAARANLTLLPSEISCSGISLHHYAGWDIGAAAYLIARQGAQIVLADKRTKQRDLDVAMFHDNSRLFWRLRPLQANPGLVIQAASAELRSVGQNAAHATSDLVPSRQSPLHPVRFRIAQLIQRDVIQASRKFFYRVALGGTRMRVPFKPN